MSPSKARWLLFVVALLAGSSGFLVRELIGRSDEMAVPMSAAAAVPQLLALPLVDADGKSLSLAKWRGKPMLINFWATWCSPCREEMPLLNRVASRQGSGGVQFIGVAYDDPVRVKQYVASHASNYPLVVVGAEISNLFPALGNTALGLPFTILLGDDGSVLRLKLGPFRAGELEKLLSDALTTSRVRN